MERYSRSFHDEEAALKLGFVPDTEFDRIVAPVRVVKPYVAAAA